ncbi:hypothetical protein [Methylomonas sp. AM2-LC]|uniref:hypothetical protein n=1 Tax=Methylomonas sp. AM2-LC TaxID=3153301 RepID=UPI003266E956
MTKVCRNKQTEAEINAITALNNARNGYIQWRQGVRVLEVLIKTNLMSLIPSGTKVKKGENRCLPEYLRLIKIEEPMATDDYEEFLVGNINRVVVDIENPRKTKWYANANPIDHSGKRILITVQISGTLDPTNQDTNPEGCMSKLFIAAENKLIDDMSQAVRTS